MAKYFSGNRNQQSFSRWKTHIGGGFLRLKGKNSQAIAACFGILPTNLHTLEKRKMLAKETPQEDAEPAEPVKRRRGRPRGYPKSGGRTKQSKDRQEMLKEGATLSVEFLLDVIKGREQRTSGPTGKSILRQPTIDEKLRAAERILSRVIPTLSSQELSAKEGLEPFKIVLSQADARLVSPEFAAKLAGGAIDAVASEPDTKMIGSSDETQDGEAVSWHSAAAPTEGEPDAGAVSGSPNTPQLGERILLPNGAQCILSKMEGSGRLKWAVLDAQGQLHGYRTDRRVAELFGESLKAPIP